MKSVTRDVDLESVRDLLERVPRACLSFAGNQGPQAQPVALRWRDGHYLVSMSGEVVERPSAGQEVVLLVDEGIYYFELRAIYIRGQVKILENPPDASADRKWLEVIPTKIVAWDYGMLREVKDES